MSISPQEEKNQVLSATSNSVASRFVVRNPDLERIEKFDKLLQRKMNFQTSRQLAEITESIQSFPLLAEKFCHMNNQALRRALELIELKKFESGEIIFNKGDE